MLPPAITILVSDAISFYLVAALFLLPFFFVLFLAIKGTAKPKPLLIWLPAAVLLALVVSAYLTPTTDILNVALYSLPMIGLYVVSIVIAWLHPVHRRERTARQGTSSKLT